jgi:hypothetical protein
MTNENISIVLVDSCNESLHQDGKLNHMIRESLDKTNTIPNLHKLLAVARNKKFPSSTVCISSPMPILWKAGP